MFKERSSITNAHAKKVSEKREPRRNYESPRILSVEQLEVAAAGGCDQGGLGLGKTFPGPCSILGS